MGTSLVEWLGLYLQMQWVWIQFLVGGAKIKIPHASRPKNHPLQTQEVKQKPFKWFCYHSNVTDSVKTLKVIQIKKIF